MLNEASTLDRLLESIERQTRPPDEIVIVDGGSTDGTAARLGAWRRRLPLRIIQASGVNISLGRNLAIEAASAEVIAVTDAGVSLEADWLEQLLARLSPTTDVVSGFFTADPQSPFERALGATTLPNVEDIRPDTFLPSSRSVLFRRAAWQRVGGYPEWLDYCEDLVFDRALAHAGCQFAFAPAAIARFRPRRNLWAFFRQYYLYARGDGKAGLWPRRHAIRYATYATAMLLLVRRHKLTWLCALGAAAYTWRPYRRLDTRGLGPSAFMQVVALVPLIRGVGDVAKMLGYPVGVVWRAQRTWTSRSSS